MVQQPGYPVAGEERKKRSREEKGQGLDPAREEFAFGLLVK